MPSRHFNSSNVRYGLPCTALPRLGWGIGAFALGHAGAGTAHPALLSRTCPSCPILPPASYRLGSCLGTLPYLISPHLNLPTCRLVSTLPTYLPTWPTLPCFVPYPTLPRLAWQSLASPPLPLPLPPPDFRCPSLYLHPGFVSPVLCLCTASPSSPFYLPSSRRLPLSRGCVVASFSQAHKLSSSKPPPVASTSKLPTTGLRPVPAAFLLASVVDPKLRRPSTHLALQPTVLRLHPIAADSVEGHGSTPDRDPRHLEDSPTTCTRDSRSPAPFQRYHSPAKLGGVSPLRTQSPVSLKRQRLLHVLRLPVLLVATSRVTRPVFHALQSFFSPVAIV